MPSLTRELRRALENTVRAARRAAEAGARKVIEQLAVNHHEPWPSMTPAQRELRNRLRAHGRQLGDLRDERRGLQAIDRLTTECAYGHWHRMLFARFLAETELLIEPQSGMAISLAECEELARSEGRDWLDLAADYALRMLPQIFRTGDPVLEVALPPETRSALEDLMKALPRDVFVADDSLGWVYQYWQADRKEEVNRSEKKIGADELPAVTQLFTEDYMVLFLLHNTLGAWWAGKVLAANPELADSATHEAELRAACAVGDVEWTYLRFVKGIPPLPPGEGRGEGAPRYHDLPQQTRDFARQLRQNQPDAEKLFWGLFRDCRLGGFKFRRQHPVPPYVLDFYCHEACLAVELDGGQHAEARARDERRTRFLANQGIRVLRFWNNQALNETQTVLEAIWNALHEGASMPPAGRALTPDPAGRGTAGTARPHPRPLSRRERGEWRPAAGTFDGWPTAAKDITLLDPCMGSGHFLVFALPMLAALRAAEESLSPENATLAVLRDNLFGLEIDPRCTQIAAFNLALAAWRRIGYRQLPALHLACSGLSLGVTKAEWLELAERAAQALPVPPKVDLFGAEDNLFSDAMKRGFERLYDLFARAPWLGSLIGPAAAGGDLVEHGFADLEPLLREVLAKADTAEVAEMAVAAEGLAKAGEILAGRFTLVATNVPYLGRGKQDESLKDYCERHHPQAKADLATCFVERCLDFCAEGGSTALVTPDNWLFLSRYRGLRTGLLRKAVWCGVAQLGPGAFETISGEVVNVALLLLSNAAPNRKQTFFGIDAQSGPDAVGKAALLNDLLPGILNQESQRANPDAIIALEELGSHELLKNYGNAWQGVATSDIPRFQRSFWEIPSVMAGWRVFQSTVDRPLVYGGRSLVLFWEDGRGQITEVCQDGATFRGQSAWGKKGVVISQMTRLSPTLYSGDMFDCNCAAITLNDESLVAALWSHAESGEHVEAVRKINQKLNVTNSILAKVPFDLARWQRVAREIYPNGLPKPYSADPTQWLFNGHPKGSDAPLQVAVARLVGYRWPRQTGSSFMDCPALGPDGLEKQADPDGIVTLNPVNGEQPAASRLIALLADAFGEEWSAARLDALLSQVGFAGKTLDDWLRDGFFEQHCALFHQRPFVWHIWGGRRDGFHALVNYHRLAARGDENSGEGRRTLEKLLYSYLGDWIDRQRADQKAGVEGADTRVAAAEHLKTELTNILAGEPPYDVFVRWKPLHEQPIGWEPDINDGVRMNIHPFMTARPLGARAKGACILRTTPKIKWDKDRGKEPQRPREDYPWFWGWDEQTNDFADGKTFDGNRWNDLHYSRAFKGAARKKRSGQ